MDCLPVVQTSALAGVAGISFLLFLVPGTIAGVVFAPRHRVVAALPLILPLLLICWGAMRLREPPAGPTIKVGLIASDAPANLRPRDPARIQTTFEAYAAEAQALIRQGARLIVIPVERWTDAAKLNELRVYGPNGKLQAVYEKHHMLPAFEGALLPGSSLTILSEPSGTWGLEI
jgi:apolipoprotein N-acyltransferase